MAAPGERPLASFDPLSLGKPEAALAYFDGLPPVACDEMLGRWEGSEVTTGHPLDGLLGPLGWYGKEFVDAETVHPLLFQRGDRVEPVNPDLVPLATIVRHPRLTHGRSALALARFALPLFRTHRPKARLRMTEYRGISSATMIYDGLPIHDVFRRVSADTVLGAMDLRFCDRPFFFRLTQVPVVRMG